MSDSPALYFVNKILRIYISRSDTTNFLIPSYACSHFHKWEKQREFRYYETKVWALATRNELNYVHGPIAIISIIFIDSARVTSNYYTNPNQYLSLTTYFDSSGVETGSKQNLRCYWSVTMYLGLPDTYQMVR